MHQQSPYLLLFQLELPIFDFSQNQNIVVFCHFLTPKSNCVNVLLIFNAFAISFPPSSLILLPYFILESAETENYFTCAFSPSNSIFLMRNCFSMLLQSSYRLPVQYHCSSSILVEIQDDCALFCCFLNAKSNCVNVLLIVNAFAISLPPSAPILLPYLNFS